jgi:myo-inositol-1(or 4)-monophosphatase
MDLSQLSTFGMSAVMESEKLLLDSVENITVFSKESKRDIASELDLKIESFVADKLKSTGIEFLGEETFQNNSFDNKLMWVLDPIDGTVNYVSGLPTFCISLGLVKFESGIPQFLFGVVNAPDLGKLYYTMGANQAFENKQKISRIDSSLSDSIVSMCFSGSVFSKDHRRKEYEVFGILNETSRGVYRMGSAAVQICYTASNKIGATFGFNIPIWDIAGSLAVANNAGCTIYIAKSSVPERFNFIVGSKSAVTSICEVLRSKQLWK